MAGAVIHLHESDMNALHRVARQEHRPVKSPAACVIRNEPKRPGLVNEPPEDAGKQKTSPANAQSETED